AGWSGWGWAGSCWGGASARTPMVFLRAGDRSSTGERSRPWPMRLSLRSLSPWRRRVTATADLKVDCYRPGKPGRLICRARVRHRTRRLAFCEASVEQESGEIIAEARAVIAYVRA